VAPLDPAGRDAQAPGHADVVILALRDVQVVGLLEAPLTLVAAAGVGEVLRVGLLAQRVVAAQRHVERVAERLLEMVSAQRCALVIVTSL
jgi:hypothetical protein